MSEERKINGINEFLQMSMTNNMPLSVNEKRQIFDLIIDLQTQLQQKENIIKEVREYITSYESISTIQGLEDIEINKDLDEKTLNEMVRRYMIVHNKLLGILDKVEE